MASYHQFYFAHQAEGTVVSKKDMQGESSSCPNTFASSAKSKRIDTFLFTVKSTTVLVQFSPDPQKYFSGAVIDILLTGEINMLRG